MHNVHLPGVLRRCNQWQWRAVHTDVKLKYEALIAAGELRFDAHQVKVVEQLQELQRHLDGYEPTLPGLWDKVGQDLDKI